MISAKLLDALDQCGRVCRGVSMPFGNLPVLLCGKPSWSCGEKTSISIPWKNGTSPNMGANHHLDYCGIFHCRHFPNGKGSLVKTSEHVGNRGKNGKNGKKDKLCANDIPILSPWYSHIFIPNESEASAFPCQPSELHPSSFRWWFPSTSSSFSGWLGLPSQGRNKTGMYLVVCI